MPVFLKTVTVFINIVIKIVIIKTKGKECLEKYKVLGEALRDDPRGQIEETKTFVCKNV